MVRELRAGISYNYDTAQTVLIEVEDTAFELQHIAEQTRDRYSDYWFLDGLLNLDKKILKKISKIYVALDNAVGFFHRFPLDSSLGKVEQNEQVDWELAQYKQNFKRQDYINELHVLRTRVSEQYLDVLIVAIPRSFLFGMQELLTERELDLHLVDLNYFAAAHALHLAHPETKTGKNALVGVSPLGVNVGCLSNAKFTSYANSYANTIEETTQFLELELLDSQVTNIFLHGTTSSQNGIDMSKWTKALRSALKPTVTVLNPFRRIRVASSCKNFSQYVGHEHHFAACVGSALRE